MSDRDFSDSIQFQAVLLNLEKNNGQLKCALCGRNLTSKSECHFDHVFAYAKGGKSTLDNCQILCSGCNLSKSDKDLHDFILEEKAKRFMSGETINCDSNSSIQLLPADREEMTKEKFDAIVGAFVEKHGDIKKIDFTRDKNGLPSIMYVTRYYGSMNNLKQAFGLKIDMVWNRENIWERLVEFSRTNPEFKQSDLMKKNNLPSIPCVLNHYPEYRNFSEIRTALGLDLNIESWTKEKVVDASKEFLKTHSKITQKDLRKENGLPTSKVIYTFFGSMQNFQKEVGSEVSKRNEFISKEELLKAAKELANQNGSNFESRSSFLKAFPYSESVILDRFNSFDSFLDVANIAIINKKKAKYTKQEVDDCILLFLKQGNPIPSAAKQLSSLGLPSSATILRFYDDWKEPFLVFAKMLSLASK